MKCLPNKLHSHEPLIQYNASTFQKIPRNSLLTVSSTQEKKTERQIFPNVPHFPYLTMQSVKTTLTISNILTKTSGPKQFWLCAQWYIQCTTVHAFRIKFYTLVFNLKCAEYSSIQKKLNKTANT